MSFAPLSGFTLGEEGLLASAMQLEHIQKTLLVMVMGISNPKGSEPLVPFQQRRNQEAPCEFEEVKEIQEVTASIA